MSRLQPFKIARNEFFNLSLRKVAAYFYYKFLAFKDRKYASPGIFNYQWDKINFNRTGLINYIICNHPLGTNLSYLEIGTAGNATFNAIPIPKAKPTAAATDQPIALRYCVNSPTNELGS